MFCKNKEYGRIIVTYADYDQESRSQGDEKSDEMERLHDRSTRFNHGGCVRGGVLRDRIREFYAVDVPVPGDVSRRIRVRTNRAHFVRVRPASHVHFTD